MNKFTKIMGLFGLLLAICFVASCSSKAKPTAIVDFVSQRVSIKANVTIVDPEEVLVDGAAYLTIYESSDEDKKVIETKTVSPTKTTLQEFKFLNLDNETEYVITLYFTYNKTKHTISENKILTTSSGSEDDPIIVNSLDKLLDVSSDEEAHYILGNDIDCNGSSISPLFSNSKAFTGSFDGKNFKISNFTIGTEDSPLSLQYGGLFGYSKGTIKNLKIADVKMFTKRSSTSYLGLVAGYNAGPVSNVTCENITIIASSSGTGRQYIGGFIGQNGDNGDVKDCSISNLNLTVNAKNLASVGGFFGENIAPTIAEKNQVVENCFVTGAITVTQINTGLSTELIDTIVGGFAGVNLRTISDCYADCDITVSNTKASTSAKLVYKAKVGGLVGELGASAIASIANSAYQGKITLTSNDLYNTYVGGIAGYVGQWGTVKNSLVITKDSSLSVTLAKDLAHDVAPLIGYIATATKGINNACTAEFTAVYIAKDNSTDPATLTNNDIVCNDICSDYTFFAEEVLAFINASK